MSDLILPRKYKNDDGNYPQHLGKPKLSYSQYSSWTDPLYEKDYIRSYFMGHWDAGNIYTRFGSACGKYFEDLSIDRTQLSVSDVEILKNLERPSNARYEVEVLIDRGWYVIQGFIDQETEISDNVVQIKDLKTGNIIKRKKTYSSSKYQQTTLYSYQREVEGKIIDYSGVTLLGRAGTGTKNAPLRLTGEIELISTPYSLQRAEQFLLEVDIVAEQIAEEFYLFNKIRVT